jgi:hypothetical protein
MGRGKEKGERAGGRKGKGAPRKEKWEFAMLTDNLHEK